MRDTLFVLSAEIEPQPFPSSPFFGGSTAKVPRLNFRAQTSPIASSISATRAPIENLRYLWPMRMSKARVRLYGPTQPYFRQELGAA